MSYVLMGVLDYDGEWLISVYSNKQQAINELKLRKQKKLWREDEEYNGFKLYVGEEGEKFAELNII